TTADAHTAGLVAGSVLDVLSRQAAGAQHVLAGVGRAGDHAALQVGVAPDGYLEAALARSDAGLLVDAGVVAVGLLLTEVDAAAAAVDERTGSESLTLASDSDFRLWNLPCKHFADTGK
ncbi:MAG TPA: hypothetical protein VFH31_21635, partial [Pyrinomonadaceae bacterium]|nr:hypothetical protein [Pyrinomonadaceae bacterium]